MSNREIADELVIHERTVCTHVSSILDKLHLASRTQAALFALKEGYASLEEIPGTDAIELKRETTRPGLSRPCRFKRDRAVIKFDETRPSN